VKREREENGRAEKTTFGIVDAQSVKTTETAQEALLSKKTSASGSTNYK
jgi:hypothetical protein